MEFTLGMFKLLNNNMIIITEIDSQDITQYSISHYDVSINNQEITVSAIDNSTAFSIEANQSSRIVVSANVCGSISLSSDPLFFSEGETAATMLSLLLFCYSYYKNYNNIFSTSYEVLYGE